MKFALLVLLVALAGCSGKSTVTNYDADGRVTSVEGK